MSSEDLERTGNSDHHHTGKSDSTVDEPTMQNVDTAPRPSTSTAEPTDTFTLPGDITSTTPQNVSDDFPYLWTAVADSPLPSSAQIKIMHSLAKRTKIQYESYLARWWEFALSRAADPHHPAEADIVCFLDSLTNIGLGYSAINAAKSAVLFVLSLRNEVVPEMMHLKKYMTGTAAMAPPSTKSALVWDPQTFLDYFIQGPHNDEMDLADLT